MKQRLYDLISEECGYYRISDSTSFRGEIGADSLELASLMIAIEAEFQVEVPHDISGFLTVGDVYRYLCQQFPQAS